MIPKVLMTKVCSGYPLATRPGLNAMGEEATSEENEITQEVSNPEVQLVNEKASTFSETSSSV